MSTLKCLRIRSKARIEGNELDCLYYVVVVRGLCVLKLKSCVVKCAKYLVFCLMVVRPGFCNCLRLSLICNSVDLSCLLCAVCKGQFRHDKMHETRLFP